RDFSDEPWYVAGKDESRNVLVATQGREHPLLWSRALCTETPHWLAGQPPADSFRCTAKTRYRQSDVECAVTVTETGTEVTFTEPVWAVTPGQYAVFYDDDVCLGGAIIRAPIQPPAG
ncbi:MAG: tRNA 2-thiouridine(34) synthase MnmA, partial [Gammaproteobacteria bacterium]|nr:tRNA 2-thiouridine(34) synthase MnmA [Gammaproteobacteria bacterium]